LRKTITPIPTTGRRGSSSRLEPFSEEELIIITSSLSSEFVVSVSLKNNMASGHIPLIGILYLSYMMNGNKVDKILTV
jgi:hypothetical protein